MSGAGRPGRRASCLPPCGVPAARVSHDEAMLLIGEGANEQHRTVNVMRGGKSDDHQVSVDLTRATGPSRWLCPVSGIPAGVDPHDIQFPVRHVRHEAGRVTGCTHWRCWRPGLHSRWSTPACRRRGSLGRWSGCPGTNSGCTGLSVAWKYSSSMPRPSIAGRYFGQVYSSGLFCGTILKPGATPLAYCEIRAIRSTILPARSSRLVPAALAGISS